MGVIKINIKSSAKQKKNKYIVFLKGTNQSYETYAVSSKKAVNNVWWKMVKEEDPYTPRNYDPEDFDCVLAED